jgi:uncharacterized membrane protein
MTTASFLRLYALTVAVFLAIPALERQSLTRAIALGAFFGLVTYATYDLTNLATLDRFPGLVVMVDMAWGTVLCGAVAAAAFKLGGWVS